MDRKIKTSKLNFWFMTMVFFSLILLNLFDYDVIRNKGYLIIAFFPILVLLIENNKFIKKHISLCLNSERFIFYWGMFIFLMILSEIQNAQLSESLIYLSIPLLIGIFNLDIKRIIYSLELALTPFFLAAFVGAVSGNKFTSNTIGLLVSAFMILSFVIILFFDVTIVKKLVFIIFDLLGLFSLMKINSRTAQLIVFTAMVLGTLIILYRYLKILIEKKILSKKVIAITLTIMGFIIIMLFKGVLLKILTPKWNPNDISTGRFGIWETTIKNWNLFGHSYTWYVDSGLFGKHKGPHNIFIGILGYSGILALISFIMFLVGLLMYTIKNRKNLGGNFTIALFIFILTIVKGLTEGMIYNGFYHIYNILFIVSISFLIKSVMQSKKQDINLHYDKLTKFSVKMLMVYFTIVLCFTIFATVFKFDLRFLIEMISRYI